MKRPVNDLTRSSLPCQDRPEVNYCGPVLLTFIFIFGGLLLMLTGCQTPSGYRLEADRAAQAIIQEKESQIFDRTREIGIRPHGPRRSTLSLPCAMNDY